MAKNKGRRVIISTMGMPDNPDEIWAMASDDPDLINYINDYALRQKVKVLQQRQNVVQTEKGFFIALWECDLTKAAEA